MTDEEMAKEYADEYGFGSDCNNLASYEANHEIEQAFLAGLEAGRLKWHKLCKNPDDLPTDKHFKITSDGDIALYDCFWGKWYDLRSDELTYHPAAWCEIPRFEEGMNEN